MSGQDAPPWTTIESDPGVFTELMDQMGVSGCQMEEVFALDSLAQLKPVYGLIFLFKYQRQLQQDGPAVSAPDQVPVYFSRQVITNACATQAIMHVLLNRPEISLGPELSAFRDFTADFSPELKGESLGHSELIRQVHNSFAAPHAFLSEEARAAREEDDLFHFIAYLPRAGRLWELDGLTRGPIDHGACTEEDWLDRVRPSIQARIERYSATEIRFNLMAVVADRREVLRKRLQELARQQEITQQRGQAEEEGFADAPAELAELQAEAAALEQDLQVEEDKRARWREDNAARKHNWLPLMFTLLRVLAQRRQLQPLTDRAKARPP